MTTAEPTLKLHSMASVNYNIALNPGLPEIKS